MHISYSIFHLSSGEAITVFLLLYPGDCAAYFLLLIFSTLTPKKGHFSNFFEQGKTIKGVVWGLKGQVKGEPSSHTAYSTFGGAILPFSMLPLTREIRLGHNLGYI